MLREITLDGMQAQTLKLFLDALQAHAALPTETLEAMRAFMRERGIDDPEAWLADARAALIQ